jgi:hypothetical protein
MLCEAASRSSTPRGVGADDAQLRREQLFLPAFYLFPCVTPNGFSECTGVFTLNQSAGHGRRFAPPVSLNPVDGLKPSNQVLTGV